MSLLIVETKTDGRARVQVHADAVLLADAGNYGGYGTGGYTPRALTPTQIFAMSLIGSEQAIRSIASGCALAEPSNRTTLEFTGNGRVLSGTWAPAWNHQSQTLASGAMHMVAMPAVTIARDIAGQKSQHVIIPPGPGLHEQKLAIYRRLLLCYTTPIIPIEIAAQPDDEKAAAMVWVDELCTAIMEDRRDWKPLHGHPDQTDRSWQDAGLLTISQQRLDGLVSELVSKGHLPIPRRHKAVAA